MKKLKKKELQDLVNELRADIASLILHPKSERSKVIKLAFKLRQDFETLAMSGETPKKIK